MTTTRSTKMMIPLGSQTNNPIPTPSSPTPTKRKRSHVDSTTTNNNPAPTSWLGIAFQLPSVIKKEINDFVKAVRGGATHTHDNNHPANTDHRNPPSNPRAESTRTRRYLKRSSRLATATNPRHHPCSPTRIGSTPEEDRPPRLPSPHFSDLDLPSPTKKLRRAEKLSNMTLNEDSGNQARNDQITHLQQQQHAQLMSLGQPTITQAVATSASSSTPLPQNGTREHVPSSSADDPSKSQDGPVHVQRSHEQYEHDDAEMEEILPHRVQHAANAITLQPSGHLAGSNSVLFPDSRHMRPHDSPGSSVNADISSSTWQASSSFSTNSGSNMNRGFSNHTSLTSNTSVDLNALEDLKNHSIHSSRLNSGCSMPSPRIRHTKVLGSPRSSSRMNTLSASSFSSVGSIINTGLTTHRSFGYQLGATYERSRGVTNSSNNLAPTLQASASDHERELLTSDSDTNNDEAAAIQIGRRIVSQRPAPAYRRKVPLVEIIGRPLDASPSLSSLQSHLGSFRESNELNPSPSIGSIASAFAGCPFPPSSNLLPAIQPQSVDETGDKRRSQTTNEKAEESSFSVTNTSSSLNTLRSQLSDNLHSCNSPSADSASNDMTKSLPSPRVNHHQDMIVEVDEDADSSYEFLEREEAQGLAFETPNRKRKRLLHRSDLIHFRRPGLAAIDLAASKLIDIHPGQSQPKPKTKVMQKLGLSRGHHKRTDHSRSITDVDDNQESPTKKIRVLQSEITRLRQELENEKTKSAQRNSMYMSLDRADRRASQSTDSPHVTFSPRSQLCVSSPVSASGVSSRRCQPLSPSRGPSSSNRNSGMTDSPVVVKKPCDGATVGGSPFIVSRVFGQGPEVVGESTPAQAEKWLQKKVASATQGSARVSGLAHDLFGAKSSKAAHTSSGSAAYRPTSANSNASSGWNRDRELEADLFSSPRARTLKKLNRNSKSGLAALQPRSNIRNMFRNSINDFHRHGGPSSSTRPSTAGAQPPDMTTFLNELKSSGRSKLRKTPGSAKYYNIQRPIGSPKSNPRKFHDPLARRSVDCHNVHILSSVLQNYPPNSQRHSKNPDGSHSSRTSALSDRTQGSASSANTHDADGPNTPTAPKHQPHALHQCRSPLACKVYPSGKPTKSHEAENNAVHVVLGEAISTPRKSKRAGQLSRSLVDPHRTPRARGFPDVVQPTSPIQADFTMDELIQQVKELKDHQSIVDEEDGGPPVSRAENKLRNHELVHEMGFCSSNENSLEIGSFPQTILGGGSNPSPALMSPVTNSGTASQGSNRQRSSPMLKSLTQGRPKPNTSPTKVSTPLTKANSNRWSSQSTIRLVSILNHSINGCNASEERSGENPAASLRTKPNERRVRILEDHTNLNKSRTPSESSNRRHSMPVNLANPDHLASFYEDENEQPEDTYDRQSTQPPMMKVAQPWVVLKPDSDRQINAEPNVRRWSLKTSAIISAHPKII